MIKLILFLWVFWSIYWRSWFRTIELVSFIVNLIWMKALMVTPETEVTQSAGSVTTLLLLLNYKKHTVHLWPLSGVTKLQSVFFLTNDIWYRQRLGESTLSRQKRFILTFYQVTFEMNWIISYSWYNLPSVIFNLNQWKWRRIG